MTYEQVRDILRRIGRLHGRMRDYVEDRQPELRDVRCRQLLDWIRADEAAIELALESYAGDDAAAPEVLDTWLQYVPDEETERAVRDLELPDDLSVEDAISRKIEFDRALVELYRQLAAATSVPRVQELFEQLAQTTEQRAAQQVWSVRELEGEGPQEPSPSDE